MCNGTKPDMECAGSLDTGGNGDWYTENKRGSTERERNNLRPSETGEESALRLPLKTIYVQQHSIVVLVVVVVGIFTRKPSGPILETRTKRANNNRNNNSATDRREKKKPVHHKSLVVSFVKLPLMIAGGQRTKKGSLLVGQPASQRNIAAQDNRPSGC